MSTLDMGIYRLCPRQWTGLTSLTPLTPSLPLVQATERHFFSHRCQASSDREIHPSSSSPQILSHLSPSYQTLTGHEALLVIAFLGFDIWRRQSNSLKPPDINELFINPQPEKNMQVKFFKKITKHFYSWAHCSWAHFSELIWFREYITTDELFWPTIGGNWNQILVRLALLAFKIQMYPAFEVFCGCKAEISPLPIWPLTVSQCLAHCCLWCGHCW